MTTYRELKEKGEALIRQAEEMRMEEIPGVIAEIKGRMAEYGIYASDLSDDSSQHPMKRAKPANAKGVPKYKDAKTGKTWTGKGRHPEWVTAALAEGKTLDDLVI